MRLARSRAAASAAFVPLVLTLAACNGDKQNASAESSPEASLTSSPSPSPTPSPSETASGPTKVEDPAGLLTAMQAAMRKAGSAHVDMDMGQATATGDIAFAGSTVDTRLVMDVAGTRMDLRYVDGVMYMSMPGMTPRGKFIRVDSSSKTMGQLVQQMESMSPDESILLLRRAVKGMTDLGEEKVGGETAEHYVVRVDAREMLRTLMSSMPKGSAGSLPDQMSYDMWVTGSHLIRRMVMDVSTAEIQVDYTRWGAPVTIQAPPTSAIMATPPGF